MITNSSDSGGETSESTTTNKSLLEVVDKYYYITQNKNDGYIEVNDRNRGVVVHRVKSSKKAATWAINKLVEEGKIKVEDINQRIFDLCKDTYKTKKVNGFIHIIDKNTGSVVKKTKTGPAAIKWMNDAIRKILKEEENINI